MKEIKFLNNTEIFFEEYEIFKKILKNRGKFFTKIKNFFWFDKKIFRILDLWSWNWRFNLLIQKIFEEEKINQKKIFYWLEKNFSENVKNFSDVFINTDIENFLDKKENFVWDKYFNFVIISWIFENFLKFDEKILNKIYKILEKNWVVFINFWNYWEENNLFREKNISEVKKYFEENFLPKIKKSKFWEKFEASFNEKERNWGWNISLVLRK